MAKVRPLLLLLTLLTALFCSNAPLRGAQLPVTSLADNGPGSLRAAILLAQPGDTLLLQLQGEIRLDSTLRIRKSLTILGPGAALLALNGNSRVRIMQIGRNYTVFIADLSFMHGNAEWEPFPGGGAINSGGHLSLKRCVLRYNYAAFGGAIELVGSNGENPELHLEACAFIQNRAEAALPPGITTPRAGGAIYSDSRGGYARIRAINCTFSGNIAHQGGGAVKFFQNDTDTTTTFTCIHCTIARNEALRPGGVGGVDTDRYGRTFYRNTLIAENKGKADNPDYFGNLISGGGLLVGNITLNSSIGYGAGPNDTLNAPANLAPLADNGGGLFSHLTGCGSAARDRGVAAGLVADQRGQGRHGLPDIGATEFNPAFDSRVRSLGNNGAGSLRYALSLACDGDTLDMQNLAGQILLRSELVVDKSLTLLGNPVLPLSLEADSITRLLRIEAGKSVNISRLGFYYGRPGIFGGGAILNYGSLRLNNCTFFGNSAAAGGAIGNYGYADTTRLWVDHCSFAQNRATMLGGGAIENYAPFHPAYMWLNHCTFSDNHCVRRGGALHNELQGDAQAIVWLHNSLMAGNTATFGAGADIFGDFRSEGYNLYGDLAGTLTSAPGDIQTGSSAGLGPFQWHGGPHYCFSLTAGSPAINAADPASSGFDQRGYPRVAGGRADIGAFEYDAATAIEPAAAPVSAYIVPNPNTGRFRLEAPGLKAGHAAAALFDLAGRELQQFALNLQQVGVAELDVQGLPPGVYLLRVQQAGAAPLALKLRLH